MQLAVVDEVMHRHQFDGSHPELEQMIDHRCGRKSGIGSAQSVGNTRMPDVNPRTCIS